MTLKPKFIALLLFAVFVSHINSGHATIYPELTNKNSRVIYVKDPAVGHASIVRAINLAKHDVTILIHVFGSDDLVGKPIIQALYAAAVRGVRVRILTTKLGSIDSDFWNTLGRTLADQLLPVPPQVILFGGFSNLLRRLKFTDTNHEKIISVDAGTPDEVVFFRGRNLDEYSLRNHDLGFIVKRIRPNEVYLGDQLVAIQEQVWGTISQLQKPFPVGKGSKRINPNPPEATTLLITEEQRDQFVGVQRALALPEGDDRIPEGFEDFLFVPKKLQAINNDFFRSLTTQETRKLYKKRFKLPSDNHNKIVEMIQNAKRIDLSLMAVFFPEDIQNAFVEAIKRGVEFNLYTNSHESSKAHVRMGTLFKNGLQNMAELLQTAEATGNEKVRIYTLNSAKFNRPNLENPTAKYFTHRKLIIIDGEVISGSDNFTVNSLARNSEVIVTMEDDRLPDVLLAQLEAERELYSELSCEAAILGAKSFARSPFERIYNLLVKRFY